MVNKLHKKYWYIFQIIECVLCGRQKKSKWRVYSKPSLEEKVIFDQDACPEHFI